MYEFEIDTEAELDKLSAHLDDLRTLRESQPSMTKRDQDFAESLYSSYRERGGLSDKQWYWVDQLVKRVKGLEPIYGSFNAILVMFRLASSNDQGRGLKNPKIRLMTKEGRFVQLNFKPEENSKVDIYVDGWAGHGYRKFAGKLEDEKIIPYRDDRMTEDVKLTIQEFSLDPLRTAKAMSKRLGACMYCGSRLTDPRSKDVGYGPTCATNYGLPWGDGAKAEPLPSKVFLK